MSSQTQNTRLTLAVFATLIAGLLFVNGAAKAATVTYANVQQERDPVGPLSVPDFSLPNQILLPTPGYEVQDNAAVAGDPTEASFRFMFEADVAAGEVATTVGLRQRLGFEFDDPEELANFVRAETTATIAYTEINGTPVDPDDPANQQTFDLAITLQTNDVLPGGLIETLVPLNAPATAFEVTLDNSLTAFSVSGTALLTSADLQFITLTEAAVPEPGSLWALSLGAAGVVMGRRRRR